ncbi:MAG: hypothetical protein ABH881_00280 [bacterium]
MPADLINNQNPIDINTAPHNPFKINGNLTNLKKKGKRRKFIHNDSILLKEIKNPILLSVSEASKIGGVTTKTIRRAIQSKQLKYKIVNNRYFLDLTSVILHLHTAAKLKNKLIQFGLGQYVKKWKK